MFTESVSILGRESIFVGYDLLPTIVSNLSKEKFSKVVLVTDQNLSALYLDKWISAWNNFYSQLDEKLPRKEFLTYIIPAGEGSKSRKVKAQIEDYLLEQGCTRDTCIIAFGGGVIGDLVGYVAATFMRGVPVVQVPTSLLAMVDSSIGGKTAIDTPHGKNLIGAFHQPLNIYVDLSFLRTLPQREFFNGMAEIIKTAAISDAEDFELLEVKHLDMYLSVYPDSPSQSEEGRKLLQKVVVGSIKFKAHVVTEDEKESGLRGLLNFGHSIGHGIEGLVSPHLLHGECVAIGMIQEAEVSRSLGHCSQATIARLTRVLKLYQLPVSLDDPIASKRLPNQLKHLKIEDLMRIIKVDKKNIGGRKRIVLLSRVGATVELQPTFVDDYLIERAMAPAVKIPQSSLNDTSSAEIAVPGSKSISNRALVLAALGQGTCKLKGLLHSDDTQVMLEALRLFAGIQYQWEDNGLTLVIEGCGNPSKFVVPSVPLYLGNAGTASRFLTSICCLVPPQSQSDSNEGLILTGNARMKQRPIGPLVTALRENGVDIDYLENEASLPLLIKPSAKGFAGGEIRLSATVSSQYVSSILMAAPYANKEVILVLEGEHVISQPYIDMTIAMMKSFGVNVERLSETSYRIPVQYYTNPSVYQVEGDASSATYPLALAAITGRQVTVTNLGSESLQGDAGFALKVLKPMGCEVIQTAHTTQVQGPPKGQLKYLPDIDMETLTDAFLTASVLAAVATGLPEGAPADQPPVTNISGIANQRVKECDRIAAMVTELAKFGVKSWELPDGIAIQASQFEQLKAPAEGVHCYDDHRVAMSFSILGCIVPETILNEKLCVGKTWPNWWDDLSKDLKVTAYGVEVPHSIHKSGVSNLENNPSIFIIGMRGVGKTTLGKIGASSLDMDFIDLDDYYQEVYQISVRETVEQEGWDAFRDKERRLLLKVLSDFPSNTIISCGGGIVEIEENRKQLMDYGKNRGHVLHLRNDNIDHIVKFLNIDTTRPAYSGAESIQDVWTRRCPLYEQCGNLEYNIIHNLDKWDLTVVDFIQFLKNIKNSNSVPEYSPNFPSFFVCLTNPSVTEVKDKLPSIIQGSQAVELRVDLLNIPSSSQSDILDFANEKDLYKFERYIAQQVTELRHIVKSLPIIYTLRTKSEGGKLSNSLPLPYLKRLFKLGFSLGCQLVDIEMNLDVQQILSDDSISRKTSKVIASFHDLNGQLDWGEGSSYEKIKQGSHYADIVKLVSIAKDMNDNLKLEGFLSNYYSNLAQFNNIPLIAINMGGNGQLSRILNRYLTPVTHDSLPTKAAPGQLTVQQINSARHLLGLTSQKDLYLFGTPISQSPSPLVHNGWFKALGFPHQYHLCETDQIEVMRKVVESPTFGGANCTIPTKEIGIELVEELSESAKAIGAINTIYWGDSRDSQKRILKGDNTDWLALFNKINEKLQGHKPDSHRSALVLGAGGTARASLYSLHKAGFETIYLYNRTYSKGVKLAQHFEKYFKVLLVDESSNIVDFFGSSSSEVKPPQIIVDTLPGTAQVLTTEVESSLFKNSNTGSKSKNITVRFAYAKYPSGKSTQDSNLISDKASENTDSNQTEEINGLDLLREQAKYGFQLWTGVFPEF